MSLQTSETEMEEQILKLQQKIKEQEKTISKQKNKLVHLSRSNEFYRHYEFVKFKNEIVLTDMIQHLEIFINFFELDNIEYKIYGDFFERLISDSIVNGSSINIYVNYNRIERLEHLCNIFFSLKKVYNHDDYNMLKKYINEDGISINYYKLQLSVDSTSIINVILHDTTELYNLTTTCQNICITQDGITNIHDIGNKNFYSSKSNLDILQNLYNLKNKKTNLIYNNFNKKVLDNPELLNCLNSQEHYERNNIAIINKFSYLIKDCPVCLDNKKCYKFECDHDLCLECLMKHVENVNYENKNCPLCRSVLNLK